jgi:hypothetical protein
MGGIGNILYSLSFWLLLKLEEESGFHYRKWPKIPILIKVRELFENADASTYILN